MSPKPATRVLLPKRSQSKRVKPGRKREKQSRSPEGIRVISVIPTLPITKSDCHQRAVRRCVYTTLKRKGYVR